MHNIDAIVLAGGMGTRLRSVVSDRPKVLADVGGRPFITVLLDQLVAAGIERAVISTGYMADRLEQAVGATYRGMTLQFSRETEALGTGGGVRLALRHANSDSLLVLNGDSYCAVDLRAFHAFHRTMQAPASLVVTQVDDTSRFGRVEIDDTQTVVSFEEKGAASGPGLINAGLYLLRRQVAETIPAGCAVSLERDVFPRLIGMGLRAFEGGAFLDIGTPESYARAEKFFARNAPTPAAAPQATVNSPAQSQWS